MKRTVYILLLILIIFPYAAMVGLHFWYAQKTNDIANASFIVISKEEMNLRLIDYKGREIEKYAIACGKNFGNKENKGDLKTPEGLFHISGIEKSGNWSHDFEDGKGVIQGAYGPYFIRLETPGHKGIGIHGTHKPESIGTRDTEGCIRLHNDDIEKLKSKCHIGMVVIITPSYKDIMKSGKADSLFKAIKKHEESIKISSEKGQKSSEAKNKAEEKKGGSDTQKTEPRKDKKTSDAEKGNNVKKDGSDTQKTAPRKDEKTSDAEKENNVKKDSSDTQKTEPRKDEKTSDAEKGNEVKKGSSDTKKAETGKDKKTSDAGEKAAESNAEQSSGAEEKATGSDTGNK